MFEYCPMVNKDCPYAATYRGEKHCGLKTGSLHENNIKNMVECPKEKMKNKHKKSVYKRNRYRKF